MKISGSTMGNISEFYCLNIFYNQNNLDLASVMNVATDWAKIRVTKTPSSTELIDSLSGYPLRLSSKIR